MEGDKTVATVACYGCRGQVEYVQVVVHREISGRVISHRLWDAVKEEKSEDEVSTEVVEFCKRYKVERITQTDKLLRPESKCCSYCGELMLRIAEPV